MVRPKLPQQHGTSQIPSDRPITCTCIVDVVVMLLRFNGSQGAYPVYVSRSQHGPVEAVFTGRLRDIIL
eukprot:7917813-Karenia_brevis.AAC.1